MAIPAILAALGGGGGATGAVTGALNAAGMGQAAGSVSQLAGQVQGLGGATKQLIPNFGKMLEKFTAAPRKILEIKDQLVGAFRVYVDALAAPIDAINELGQSIGRFVRLSSPATFERFTFAVENTWATIGKQLEPIMRKLTDSANKLGDVFARLEPAFKPIIRATEMLIELSTDRFAAVMEAVAPGIEMGARAVLMFAKAMEPLQRASTDLIRKFTSIRNAIYGILGIPDGWDETKQQGRAVRGVRFASTEEIQRDMAVGAVKASIGGGPSKEDQAQDAMISLPQLMQNVKGVIENLPAKIKDQMVLVLQMLLEKIGGAIRDAMPQPVKEAADGVSNVGDTGALGIGGIVASEISKQWRSFKVS